MIGNQDTEPMLGTRTIFNGIHSPETFTSETVSLPELAPGEILVKVNCCWNSFCETNT